jgi:hypothetical protein
MVQRWNDTDRGKPKDSVKNPPQCHFFNPKSHGTDLVTNQDRRGKKLETNRLSYGTTRGYSYSQGCLERRAEEALQRTGENYMTNLSYAVRVTD